MVCISLFGARSSVSWRSLIHLASPGNIASVIRAGTLLDRLHCRWSLDRRFRHVSHAVAFDKETVALGICSNSDHRK